jgi:hypothetical protein
VGVLVLSACDTTQPAATEEANPETAGDTVVTEAEAGTEVPEKKGWFRRLTDVPEYPENSVNLGFLLSMRWEEAKMITPVSMDVPPFFGVAGDEIQVLKTYENGVPRRARAKGKVFVEIRYMEPAKALCQEAYVTEDEAILRGKPILQRGGSVIEGLDDTTVFYLYGSKLRVIGLHRVRSMSEFETVMPAGRLGGGGVSGGGAFPPLGNLQLDLPDLGPWTGGPNPLLPPLSPEVVPTGIRQEMQQGAEASAVRQRAKQEESRQGGGAAPPDNE